MNKLFRSCFAFSKGEVDTIFRSATTCARTQGIKLLRAPCPEGHNMGKLLIVIPRKTGKAHDRNLVRRRIKAIFYEQRLFEVKANFVLLVYSQAVSLSFDQLKKFLYESIKASTCAKNSSYESVA